MIAHQLYQQTTREITTAQRVAELAAARYPHDPDMQVFVLATLIRALGTKHFAHDVRGLVEMMRRGVEQHQQQSQDDVDNHPALPN